MSGAVENILKIHNYLNSVAKIHAATIKTDHPIRLGVLSAAAINPTSIFDPVASHSDIIIAGIAARSPAKASAQIAKYKLGSTAKVYDSYDELLASPDIDAVYIPLPNGLHAQWTIKALNSGKHVLVEKPMANNAAEVDLIMDAARRSGKVVLEAYHWRLHPACLRVRQLVADETQNGQVQSIKVRLAIPAGTIPAIDIRLDYDLGGGSCMDLCYVFSGAWCYATVAAEAEAKSTTDPDAALQELYRSKIEVESAEPRKAKHDDRIDESMKAKFSIHVPGFSPSALATSATSSSRPSSPSLPPPPTKTSTIKCEVEADLIQPKIFGVIPRGAALNPSITIETTKCQIEFTLFNAPWLYHNITIREKNVDNGTLTGKKRVEKAYVGGSEWFAASGGGGGTDDGEKAGTTRVKGEKWWTSYRYQLEAFVHRVRQVDNAAAAAAATSSNPDLAIGNGPTNDIPWVELAESRKIMEMIDLVYDKAGMPRRGVSSPVHVVGGFAP